MSGRIKEAIYEFFALGKYSSDYKNLEEAIEEDRKNISAVANAPVVIGEPASLIIEATKDVERWEVVEEYWQDHCKPIAFKDTHTQEVFTLIVSYRYPDVLEDSQWATPDEKKALINAFFSLYKAYAQKAEQEEMSILQQQAAQEKQRLLEVYTKREPSTEGLLPH